MWSDFCEVWIVSLLWIDRLAPRRTNHSKLAKTQWTHLWIWDRLGRVSPRSWAWRPAERAQWKSVVWKTTAARASSRTINGDGGRPISCLACPNRWPCCQSGRLRWMPLKAPALRPCRSWQRNNVLRTGAEAHFLVAILLLSILNQRENTKTYYKRYGYYGCIFIRGIRNWIMFFVCMKKK